MKRASITALLASLAILLTAGGASATGLLIPTQQGLEPLAIKYHRATVKIKDRVAVTHVDQVFINHTNRDLEATYIFPLPKGATVSDFYLYVNGKRTKGEVLEKNRARNIYEGIVRRMKDPGLIEYLGRDLFKCRVYPVPRNGEQRLEIEFTQVMPFEGGVMKYTYPMRTDRSSARTMQDFTMSVEIASKVPLKAIYSPSHKIYQRKKDDHHAVAGFEKSAALLDRDFELIMTVSEKDIGLNLLTYREPGEPGFFMVMASPKSEWRDKEIIGKRISFVIDTSGSMAGAKMRHAKQALKYCLQRLNADDLFNVIRFSTDVEAFEKQPVSASKGNVQRALNFVDRMEAAGGTAIDEALAMALAGHVKKSEPNLVVFMTDGHPTVGETVPEQIIKHAKAANHVAAKLFVFGVGEEINTHLLDRVSGEAQGSSTYVKPGQEIEQEMSAFYDKVSHPVLTDLKLDFGKIHEYDVLPKRIPDMFKGSQLIVMGRYRNDGHTALTLTGEAGTDRKKFVFEGKFPKENKVNDFIPRLWATRKIGFLLDNIRLGGERKELVDEVIQLSKRYGIVTPYTSYLVTEDTPQVALRTPRPEPPPRPLTTRPGWGMRRGAGGSAGMPADAPTAAAPREEEQRERTKSMKRMQVFAEKKADVMGAESGEDAVEFAGALKDMKQAEGDRSSADEASGIRYVAGRAFRFSGGAWVDLKYQAGKMKLLKVRYLGKGWFELMKRSALLKKYFSLGERLIVVVGPGKAIQVGPDGQDEVGGGELTKFLP
jgi:Ca-activated chloride channel homolog